MFSTYVSLLRSNAKYRNLWLGAVVSYFGDWFNLIGSAALIARLTDSNTAISGLFLVRFLPLFLLSPVAGLLADRFDRRAIMITSDFLRAATVLSYLLIQDSSQLWLFYLLLFLQFSLSALFIPARTAVLGNVVPRRDLVTANAIDGVTWSTMLAVGALAGGVVTGLFGINTSFVLDAFTFLLSAWFIFRIGETSQVKVRAAAAGSPADPVDLTPGSGVNLADAVRYLLDARVILVFALVKAGASLAYGALNVLEVAFSERVYPIGDDATATLGIVYAVTGVGTGLGPLVLRAFFGDRPERLRQAITVGFFAMSAGILCIALSDSLALFLLGVLIRTIGSGTTWVFSAALLQIYLPDRVRGRVFAFEFAALTATQSISILWAGVAQDSLGMSLPDVTLLMGILGLVVSTLWVIFQRQAKVITPPADA